MSSKEEKMKARKRRGCNAVVEVLDFTDFLQEAWDAVADVLPDRLESYNEFDIIYNWGLVRTERGWFYICDEGVMYPLSEFENEGGFPVSLNARGDKVLSILPVAEIRLTEDEMLSLPVKEHVPLDEFIRLFGDRLESNHRICAKELNGAGTLPPRVLVEK